MSRLNDSANKGGGGDSSSVTAVVVVVAIATEASAEAIIEAIIAASASPCNDGNEGDMGLGVACGGKGGAGGLSGSGRLGSGKGTPVPCMCRGIGGGEVEDKLAAAVIA